MATVKLRYTKEEIMADHDYDRVQTELGRRMHGGFDTDGNYIASRTKYRWPAVEAWQQQLRDRGQPILDASTELLSAENYPNPEQQKLLIKNGYVKTFSDSLTITGIIEAKGEALVQITAPDYQDIIVEDISETALGHLNKGLLVAHGLDEGGDKPNGIGGHDEMWFAARDITLGDTGFATPEVPESISRDIEGRDMPQIPQGHEMLLGLLLNVLMIEIRAEKAFDFFVDVFRDPSLFADKRDKANHSAEIVDRIRTDEAIHTAYLQTVLSEFRSFTIKTLDGKQVPGSEIIDPVWQKIVHWHGVELPKASQDRDRSGLRDSIAVFDENLLGQFDALATA